MDQRDLAILSLQRKCEELQAEVERLRGLAREYALTVGLIDCALGRTGAMPLIETVNAVKDLRAEVEQLRGEPPTEQGPGVSREPTDAASPPGDR